MKKSLYFMFHSIVSFVILLAMAGCSSSGPTGAAKSAFTNFAEVMGTPYRNDKYVTISNDGTYAQVRINVEFKLSSNSDWIEKEAVVEVRKVGDDWQAVIPPYGFKMPEKYVQETQAVVNNSIQATEQAAAQATTQAAELYDKVWKADGEQILKLISSSQDVLLKAVEKKDFSILSTTYTPDFSPNIMVDRFADKTINFKDIVNCDASFTDGWGTFYIFPEQSFDFAANQNEKQFFVYSETYVGVIARFTKENGKYVGCGNSGSGPTREIKDITKTYNALCFFVRKSNEGWRIEYFDDEYSSINYCEIFNGSWKQETR